MTLRYVDFDERKIDACDRDLAVARQGERGVVAEVAAPPVADAA
jgi:hypothetical protein